MKLLYKKENTKLSYIIILLCFINQYIALGINYTVFVLIFTIIFYIIIVKKICISEKVNNYFIAFIAKISYDIQFTDESNKWIAGNGKISDNNWIRNKSNYVEIIKENNIYCR